MIDRAWTAKIDSFARQTSTFVIATISVADHACCLNWKRSDLLTVSAQDYSMDHKEIDLLRMRSFTLGRKLLDEEILGPMGMDRIAELISCIEPFVS